MALPSDLEHQPEKQHPSLDQVQENQHGNDWADYRSLTRRLLTWGVEYRGAMSRHLRFGRTVFWSRNTTSG